jgi:stage V sporulation protein G
MKAIVSVSLDDQLAVHDIKVIHTREKLFIVMPSRKNPDGTYRDYVHPLNADFRAELENAILRAYETAVREASESSTETDA